MRLQLDDRTEKRLNAFRDSRALPKRAGHASTIAALLAEADTLDAIRKASERIEDRFRQLSDDFTQHAEAAIRGALNNALRHAVLHLIQGPNHTDTGETLYADDVAGDRANRVPHRDARRRPQPSMPAHKRTQQRH